MTTAAQTAHPRTNREFGPRKGLIAFMAMMAAFYGLPALVVLAAAVAQRAPLGIAVTASILAALGVAGWFLVVRPLRRRVLLEQDRLVDHNAGHVTEIPFERVQQVFRSAADVAVYGAKVASTSGCRIVDDRGQQCVFSGFVKDAGRIGAAVEEATFDRLFDQSLRELEQGGEVDLEALRITPDGLQTRRRLLPWNDLQQPQLSQGDLVLQTVSGRSHRVRASNVANLRVLLALVAHYRNAA